MTVNRLRNLHLSATADTNGGAAASAAPAEGAAAVADPAAPVVDPKAGGNEEAKYRRLHEKSEAEKKQLAERLATMEAAEQTRRDAELSEIERATKRAEEAEKKAADLAHEKLLKSVADKHGLTAEARELLTGGHEAALEANAARLAAIMKTPVTAGTTTQPGGAAPQSYEERISAAMKSGNDLQAIRLMREQQGITVR